MAFTAGVQRPQQNQGNSNQQQNTHDRLLTINDYNTSQSLMYAEDPKGNKYEIYVNPTEVLRNDESIQKKKTDVSKTPYLGHRIDDKMKKAMPVGSKVIVKRSKVVKKDNGNGFKQTEVTRVVRVTEQAANKTFEGIFTITYRNHEGKKVVDRLQHWADNGIDINNAEGLEQLKQAMDEAASHVGEKIGEYRVTLPTYGVQFRALMPTGRKTEFDGTDIYEMVDASIPFDWMRGPAGEDGKSIKSQGHTISGDEMVDFGAQYIDHISNNPNFKDHLDGMIIEVVPYQSYPVSNNEKMELTKGDPAKDLHAEKNPLYQMAHAVSFVDMEQSDQGKLIGKNNAVKGIVQITGDKLEKVDGKPVEIPNNWVNVLHADNIRGSVHSFIRTQNGFKVEPHELLKLQKNRTANHQENVAHAPAPAPVAAPAPAPVHEAPPQGDDDFDPFAEAPAVAPVAATPAVTKPALKFGAKK